MGFRKFLLKFLLVCMVQFVICTSTRRESPVLKVNKTRLRSNASPDLTNLLGIRHSSNDTKKSLKKVLDSKSNASLPLTRKRMQRVKNGKQASTGSDSTIPKTTGLPITMETTREQRSTIPHTTLQPSAPSTTNSLAQYNFTMPPTRVKKLDLCTTWEECPVHHHPKVMTWLQSLPSCPCRHPYGLYYNNTLYDKIQGQFFSWRKVNAKFEKLSVFKPTASHCIRQLLSNTATTTATQQCCYDDRLRLITRGSGTGTPNLVAPELDGALHNFVDLMPYLTCQGDWTRYQAVRPPNNALKCRENPDKEEFWRQIKSAKEY